MALGILLQKRNFGYCFSVFPETTEVLESLGQEKHKMPMSVLQYTPILRCKRIKMSKKLEAILKSNRINV